MPTPSRYELRVSYQWDGTFTMDDAVHATVGRDSDWSGCGMGQRDLGWNMPSAQIAEVMRDRVKRLHPTMVVEAREVKDASAE